MPFFFIPASFSCLKDFLSVNFVLKRKFCVCVVQRFGYGIDRIAVISQRNCSAAFNTIVDCLSLEGYTREFSNLSSAGLKRSLVLLLRNPPARLSIPALIEARDELNSSAMIL